MDARTFEDLSRQVGAASSRRAAAKVLASAAIAPVLGRLGQEEAELIDYGEAVRENNP